jgi:SAM-dependent methyltransferase
MQLYERLASDWHVLRPPRLAAIEMLAQLAGAPPARVVDVAAASGEYAALLQRRGFEVFAVEVSLAMCEAARGRHPDLSVIHGDMLEVFDLVRGPLALAYCLGGLQELGSLSDVADVLSQLQDLTRPAGCIVIRVPNFEHLRSRAEDIDGELVTNLTPISAFREDGSELRLERQDVWNETAHMYRSSFSAPEGDFSNEVQVLELTQVALADLLPPQMSQQWLGDWDGAPWSTEREHTIVVLRH